MCLVRGRGRGSGCGSSSPSVRCPAPCCHKLMQVSALRAVASIDDAGGSDRIAGAFTACPQGDSPAQLLLLLHILITV